MDYIVIEGVPAYAGRWEFDLDGRELTTREWGWIKRLSGYLPLTIQEGLADPELICVWACVALTRAQKVERKDVPAVFEQLSDLPLSAIKMETDVEEKVEGDAGPPPSSSSENGGSSGASSTPSSETLGIPPKASGTRGSATSVSAPPRSGS